MGGAWSALNAAGKEMPPSLNHPREMPHPETLTAEFRHTLWRHAWRNDGRVRALVWMVIITSPLLYSIRHGLNSTNTKLAFWDKRKSMWDDFRKHHTHHLQKEQDEKYFDWLDGPNPYKHGH